MAYKIADLPISEKPREKAKLTGIRGLSSRELLAILLRTGYKGCSVLELADELLQKTGGVSGLARMNFHELCQTRGIGTTKALELQACFELCRRIALENIQDKDILTNFDALISWLQREIGTSDQENFLAIYLNSRNVVLAHRLLFTGTINTANVFPREIFREALILKASNVILVHNHPSRDASPSKQDIILTKRLLEAASVMKVKLIDHIIVTDKDYYSFDKHGILPKLVTEK